MKSLHLGIALTLLLLAGCSPVAPPVGQRFYKRISTDTRTLVVRFDDPIPAIPEPVADFYWPFYRHDDHCSLDHFDTRTQRRPRIRYNALDLDPQHRITSRTKQQVVLSGEFGTFYSETRYHYPPFYRSPRTSFRVYAYANSLESEPPQISDTPIPQDARLSVISVIRILPTQTGYSLISASYAPDGDFLSVSENRSVSGDCSEGGSTTFGIEHARPERFGLPSRFPVSTYARGQHEFLAAPEIRSHLDCVSFHYNRNRIVHQDLIRSGQPAESRTLTYVVAPEDTALDSIDESNIFALNRQ